MKLKRTLSLLLAACMLLGVLAGCSKNEAGDDDKQSGGLIPSLSGDSESTAQTSAKYAYLAEEQVLDLQFEYVNQTCISGDYLYLAGEVMTDPGSGYESVATAVAVVEAVAATESSDAAVKEAESALAEAVTEDAADSETTEYVAPTYEARVYRLSLQTRELTQLEGFTSPEIPEGYEGGTSIGQMFADGDSGFWICDSMYCYTYDLPDNFDPENDYEWNYYVQGPSLSRLQHFSADGELLDTVDDALLTSEDGSSKMSICFVDEKGQIYLTDYENYYVIDKDGNVLKTFDLAGESADLTEFCGQPAIQFWSDNRNVQLIDPETFEIGEAFGMPYNSWDYAASYDEGYDFCYLYNSNLYGYKIEEQESDKLVDWMDCDIDATNMRETWMLPDGNVVGLFEVYDYENGTATTYSVIYLTKTDPSNIKQKTVLTLACMYMPWTLRNSILDFNRSNDEYRIIINDYSQYTTSEDYTAGATKLSTEIISGKIPDLLYTSDMPIAQYAAQGLLVDLLPLIDADSELSREDLMTNVIDAACIDGKLYQAFSAFFINTAIGLEKVVGEYDTWTLADLKDAMTKLQPDATVFGRYYTRDSVYYDCISRNLSYFVNWETGECRFDTQEFRDLLEFTASFPTEINWDDDYDANALYGSDALLAGVQLLQSAYIYSPESVLYTIGGYGDTEVSYVGYPSQEGNTSVFSLADGLCITTTCASQDAAWQFVRQLFTEEYQSQHTDGMAVSANLFNKQLADVQTIAYETDENGMYLLDENGEKIVRPKAYVWDEATQESIPVDCMTAEQADQLMELYNSTTVCASYDRQISDIVSAEAEGYYAGQTALDEVVKRIQNRVSLYVAEKK